MDKKISVAWLVLVVCVMGFLALAMLHVGRAEGKEFSLNYSKGVEDGKAKAEAKFMQKIKRHAIFELRGKQVASVWHWVR